MMIISFRQNESWGTLSALNSFIEHNFAFTLFVCIYLICSNKRTPRSFPNSMCISAHCAAGIWFISLFQCHISNNI